MAAWCTGKVGDGIEGDAARRCRIAENLTEHLANAAGDLVRASFLDGQQELQHGKRIQFANGLRADARKQIGFESDQLGVGRDFCPRAALFGKPLACDDFESVLTGYRAGGYLGSASLYRVYRAG